MVVIDSDILIWILRGDENIKLRFTKLVAETDGYVFITPVQIAEVYSGIREKERVKTESFFESLNVIDIDKEIGKLAGEFMSKYGRSHNVTMSDALIGAAAKIQGFKLWTLNRKHYPMLKDDEFFV